MKRLVSLLALLGRMPMRNENWFVWTDSFVYNNRSRTNFHFASAFNLGERAGLPALSLLSLSLAFLVKPFAARTQPHLHLCIESGPCVAMATKFGLMYLYKTDRSFSTRP